MDSGCPTRRKNVTGKRVRGHESSRLTTATHFLQSRIPHGTVPESESSPPDETDEEFTKSPSVAQTGCDESVIATPG
jgi:hypothetical protein